jgi:hypothetical protein
VPAIELAVEAVPLGVIKPAPGLAMLAHGRRLTRVQTGSPGAVMRLQTQFVVRVSRSQLLNTIRQPAGIEDPARTIGRFPKAEHCGEQLALIALSTGQLVGARIGPFHLKPR